MKKSALTCAVMALIITPLLSGCSDVRDAVGLTKKSPDEFQVVARPPLSIPPNFQLQPPRPGAPRPQTGEVRDQAEALILGRTLKPKTSAIGAQLSPGEAKIVARLNLDQNEPNIRKLVDAEVASFAYEDVYLIDKILFWLEDGQPGIAVDATKESQRLRENDATGKPVTEGETPKILRRGQGLFQRTF
jgi:hypothetical protein